MKSVCKSHDVSPRLKAHSRQVLIPGGFFEHRRGNLSSLPNSDYNNDIKYSVVVVIFEIGVPDSGRAMLVSSGVIRAWQQDMARVRRKREAARKEAARADEGEWMDVDGASEDDNRERLYSGEFRFKFVP